jgi:hypothetical protein
LRESCVELLECRGRRCSGACCLPGEPPVGRRHLHLWPRHRHTRSPEPSEVVTCLAEAAPTLGSNHSLFALHSTALSIRTTKEGVQILNHHRPPTRLDSRSLEPVFLHVVLPLLISLRSSDGGSCPCFPRSLPSSAAVQHNSRVTCAHENLFLS